MGAVFIHYRVEAAALQPCVPFELDLREGWAYVSFVAFTMERMRLNVVGRAAAWLTRPIATHPLLNLRTYVRHRGEAGIYFLAEWLPNPLSVMLGPRTFGLPYRLGHLRYDHALPEALNGDVDGGRDGQLAYSGEIGGVADEARPCEAGTLDEFLLERYTAFTRRGRRRRRFRVWHEPWPTMPAAVRVEDASILCGAGDWGRSVERAGAHWSRGVRDVWMGRPMRLRNEAVEEVAV